MARDDRPHRHDWKKARMEEGPITFWICLSCKEVSPGPTDNENLDPRRSEP